MGAIEQFLTERGSLGAFACLIAMKVGEFIWNYFKSREKLTDENILGLKTTLEKTTAQLAATQTDISKLRLDLKRAFFAIKKIAGEEGWAKIAADMNSLDV